MGVTQARREASGGTGLPEDAREAAGEDWAAVRVERQAAAREPVEAVAGDDEEAVHAEHREHVAERDAHVEVAVVRRDLEGAPSERAQD